MQSSVAPPTDSATRGGPDAQPRLLDAILNTSGDLIFVVGLDGTYLYVSASAARGLGLPREQIIGRTAEMVGFGTQAVWIEQQRARVIATGEHLVGDFQYPDPDDGQERNYQYHYSPLLAADGTVEAVICISRDLTEQRRAEAKAAAVNARLNAAYQRDHDIAATLQRSLLQMPLPGAFPGLEIVSRYESATRDMEVGGDFMDAFPVGPTQVALVVGDVTGKGLAAAARIAEAKFTLRGFLREYASCAIGLQRLNACLCDVPQWEGQARDGFVCLSLAIYDTATGDLTVSVACEEMPLLVRADGRTEVLPVQGMPLGVVPGEEYPVASDHLEPGDSLVLVTDGITEARGGDMLLGMEGLRHIAAGSGAGLAPAELAERIMAGAHAFSGGALNDDAAVLVAQRISASPADPPPQ